MVESFWDYRSRDAAKKAAKKRPQPDLDKTQEVQVTETDLSNTAVTRVREAIRKRWRGER